MVVGCLGDIAFLASADVVRTVSNFQWSGKVNLSTHKRLLNDSLVEFTGRQPDSISFEVILSSSLGVNVMRDCVKIWDYERAGTPLPLVLGEKCYGKYRWLIESHKIKAQSYDLRGNLETVKLTVSLIEYIRR